MTGAFLTAAFSLIPLLAGAYGLRRVIPEDPPWLPALLRASITLSSLSLLLHLIAAVIVAENVDGGAGSLLNVVSASG